MAYSLIRRILVAMLAVLVTAGMDLSAVRANTMQVQMISMNEGAVKAEMAAPDMAMNDVAMPPPAKCPDCDMTGKSKGMTDCLTPTCIAQVALAPADLVLPVVRTVPRQFQALTSIFLHGLAAVPDPYPPRISDIG